MHLGWMSPGGMGYLTCTCSGVHPGYFHGKREQWESQRDPALLSRRAACALHTTSWRPPPAILPDIPHTWPEQRGWPVTAASEQSPVGTGDSLRRSSRPRGLSLPQHTLKCGSHMVSSSLSAPEFHSTCPYFLPMWASAGPSLPRAGRTEGSLVSEGASFWELARSRTIVDVLHMNA